MTDGRNSPTSARLDKEERVIVSPQAAGIAVAYPPERPPRAVINFCANNYLGLSSHAQDFARDLFDEGVYVIGFPFPVVPRGEARIRVQLSAAHEPAHIGQAIAAFTKVGQKYDVLGKGREQMIASYGL
jgi:7-keto-8-aminopelargonate synthetase-like enzyme